MEYHPLNGEERHMTQKINCPQCGNKVDNRLDKLADHILKTLGNNIELCAWARAEQDKLLKLVKQSVRKRLADVIQTYRGKPVDRISPKRQEKLPKYLKKQLSE